MKTKAKYGFTLIELIIVISILAIIAAIAIPNIITLIDRASIAKDQTNLALLNKMTQVYSINEKKPKDIFSGFDNDEDRMQILIEREYINEPITATYRNTRFEWDIESQRWLYSFFVVAIDQGDIFTFLNKALSDFRKIGSWTKNANGFYSKSGLIFMDNPRAEYSIESEAQIGTGNLGGYGILFETSLTDDNKDSGYVLQLDRGISDSGSVILRPRESGKEMNWIPKYNFNYTNSNGVIPDKRTNEGREWWEISHTIKMNIQVIDASVNQKKLTVYIDGKLLFDDFVFTSKVESANNFTGYRAWHSTGATFEELKISPLS